MRRAVIFGILVWVILLVWAWRAWAGPYLACDLPEPGDHLITGEVEITKVSDGSVSVVVALLQVRENDLLLYDLAQLAVDKYWFRARWADATGWRSEWSPFLIAGKPAPAGGLRVVP